MPSFHNGDVEIAYLDEGEGDPIILVHGFASSKNVNWVYPTWVSDLKKDGRRVIALDNRGHGDSGKLYDSAQYEIAIMASDVIALLDHLAIERADIMGYSLGSRMTAVLAREQPQRLRSAILGGIGIGLIEGGGPGENVAAALEAPSLEDVTDPVGRTFRAFADQTRSDRRALAACLRGSRRLMTREEAAGIGVPVLIAVGTKDEIAGSAQALGKIIPGAEVLDIPNRDHMRAVGDKVYKAGVTDFLSRRSERSRGASSPVKCRDRRDQHHRGRDPRHACAVAIMRAGDHGADEGVAEHGERDGSREQSEIIERTPPEPAAEQRLRPAASSQAPPERGDG